MDSWTLSCHVYAPKWSSSTSQNIRKTNRHPKIRSRLRSYRQLKNRTFWKSSNKRARVDEIKAQCLRTLRSFSFYLYYLLDFRNDVTQKASCRKTGVMSLKLKDEYNSYTSASRVVLMVALLPDLNILVFILLSPFDQCHRYKVKNSIYACDIYVIQNTIPKKIYRAAENSNSKTHATKYSV